MTEPLVAAAWIGVGAAVWCVATVFAALVIGAAIRVSRMPDDDDWEGL